MSRLPSKLLPLLCVSALPAQVNTTLTNANFESQTGSGEVQSVDGWFESSTGNNYQDWVNIPPNNASQYPSAQGKIANFSKDEGFLYQQIGTYSGEAGLRVTGKAIRRYPGGQRALRPFRVSLYQTPATTNAAEGTHPSLLAGSKHLSSKLITASELGLASSYSSPQSAVFQIDLSLAQAGATAGSKLWLVLDAEAGTDETGLDDIAISVLTTDPGLPPGSGPIDFATVHELLQGDTDAQIVEKAAKLLPRANQVTWQRMEMTYFIHYGPNAFTGVEWGTGKESPSVFNPTALDAAQWVREIKNAGGKMVMLVTKHHDGFCLWPSRYTTQDVASSPWLGGNGDLVRVVSEACAAEGLKFGVYLSPADLYQIESATGYYGNSSTTKVSTIPTDPATFSSNPSQGRTAPAGKPVFSYPVDDYNRYFLNQLYELLTEYGPIHEVWFDGANPKPGPQTYDRTAWFDLIRKLRPEAMIAVKGPDVRWVGNENGNSRVTEWSTLPIPSTPEQYSWNDMTATDLGSRSKLTRGSFLTWYPAEADVPVLHGWFWAPNKSARTATELVNIYFNSVGRNSNLLLNLSPDNRGIIPEKQLAPVRAMGQVVKQTFSTNLASGATGNADSSVSGHSAALALDTDLDTWWEPDAGQTTPTFTLTFPSARTFDVISLQEAVAQRGQRIEAFAIDAFINGAWAQQTTVTTVGHKRLVKLASPLTTDRLRIRITQSRLEPTLAAISLHKQADLVAEPVIARTTAGQVSMTAAAGETIRYTLDGSEPTDGSRLYESTFGLPLGGTVRAVAIRSNGSRSLPATTTFGLSPIGWTATADTAQGSNPASYALDGNPATFWHTAYDGSGVSTPQPHQLTIDLGTKRWLGGLLYLPRQDGSPNGVIKRYRIEASINGSNWTVISEGAFDNIRNNPVEQKVLFPEATAARYIRFISLEEVEGRTVTSAAEVSLLPAGFDGWKTEKGRQTETSDVDTDGDGRSDWQEYAFGTNPDVPDLPTTAFAQAANQEGGVRFSRPEGQRDVNYLLQATSDPGGTWNEVNSLLETITSAANGWDILRLTEIDPPQANRRFYRLLYSLR